MINKFTDEYAFLSNFYSSPIEIDNIIYPTVEHAFQAAKTFDRDQKLKIASSASPNNAKYMGRRVHLREDWETVKDQVMYNLLKLKFSDPVLAKKLYETGNEILIEGNYWHDNYWGNCSCSKCQSKNHNNMLGKLLMKVRAELPNNN